jgi:hypothetical protein
MPVRLCTSFTCTETATSKVGFGSVFDPLLTLFRGGSRTAAWLDHQGLH